MKWVPLDRPYRVDRVILMAGPNDRPYKVIRIGAAGGRADEEIDGYATLAQAVAKRDELNKAARSAEPTEEPKD